jgi:Protein of unknown function (DUF2934)
VKRTEQPRSPQEQSQGRSSLTLERSIQERPILERSQQDMSQQEGSQQERATQKPAGAAHALGSASDVEELVRRRAYQIYEQRGMASGSAIDDWLQAEAEILDDERLNKAA